MTQVVVCHRQTSDPVDVRTVAEALTPSGAASNDSPADQLDDETQAIDAVVTANLDEAITQLEGYGRTDTVVISADGTSEFRERIEGTGNRFLGRVDPRCGAGLAPTAAARVIAAATRARLTGGPSPARAAYEPSVGDERVLVVGDVTTAANLATVVDVTLVAAASTQPPGVKLVEGQAQGVSLESGELLVTVDSAGARRAVETDQVVWAGYDGPLADASHVHTADDASQVATVVRFARDRRREPVAVDPSVCAVGIKGVPGCTACRERCPYEAIELSIEGDGAVTVDGDACIDCGACLGACPTEAITSPRARDIATLKHVTTVAIETGVDRSRSRIPFIGGGTEPLVVAFVSESCEAVVVSALSQSDLAPTVPIVVSHAQRIPAALVLYAVAAGADGVVLVGESLDGDARAAGAEPLARITESANRTFRSMALGERCQSAGVDRDEITEAIRAVDTSATVERGALTDDYAAQVSYELAATAVSALADDAELVPVEALGRVTVESAGCTLCEACDSLCPTGALEQPDAATLTLDAAECIGCERCLGCPENVIEVTQSVNPAELQTGRRTVVEAEGIDCASCGKTFASAAGMDKLTEVLDADVDPESLGLQYCPDCRRSR